MKMARIPGASPRIADHAARSQQKRGLHAQDPPEHQEHDRADAHLEGDRGGRQRTKAGRYQVGNERLEGRTLDVDSRVQQDHRAYQPAEPQPRGGRKQGHAGGGQPEADEHQRQAPPAARRGIVGQCTCPGHQEQQQDVVDRHHRADRGAVFADRIPHEQRNERAEQRTGHTGEEAAQPDEQAREVRLPRPVPGRGRLAADGSRSTAGAVARPLVCNARSLRGEQRHGSYRLSQTEMRQTPALRPPGSTSGQTSAGPLPEDGSARIPA
jgi:hypothetical protein